MKSDRIPCPDRESHSFAIWMDQNSDSNCLFLDPVKEQVHARYHPSPVLSIFNQNLVNIHGLAFRPGSSPDDQLMLRSPQGAVGWQCVSAPCSSPIGLLSPYVFGAHENKEPTFD